jgi:hypothetical protein
MDIACLQELLAYDLAGPAFEKEVVRCGNADATVLLEHGHHMRIRRPLSVTGPVSHRFSCDSVTTALRAYR